MSDSNDRTGRLGRAIQVTRDHPLASTLALFVGAVALGKALGHRHPFEDVELPEPSATDGDDLGDLSTDRNRGNGSDPLTKDIRP